MVSLSRLHILTEVIWLLTISKWALGKKSNHNNNKKFDKWQLETCYKLNSLIFPDLRCLENSLIFQKFSDPWEP